MHRRAFLGALAGAGAVASDTSNPAASAHQAQPLRLAPLRAATFFGCLSGDLETLRASQLLKSFVESFCGGGRGIELGYVATGERRAVPGLLRRFPP